MGRPLFTPEELEELRRIDAEIDKNFEMTDEEYIASEALDRHIRKSGTKRRKSRPSAASKESTPRQAKLTTRPTKKNTGLTTKPTGKRTGRPFLLPPGCTAKRIGKCRTETAKSTTNGIGKKSWRNGVNAEPE